MQVTSIRILLLFLAIPLSALADTRYVNGNAHTNCKIVGFARGHILFTSDQGNFPLPLEKCGSFDKQTIMKFFSDDYAADVTGGEMVHFEYIGTGPNNRQIRVNDERWFLEDPDDILAGYQAGHEGKISLWRFPGKHHIFRTTKAPALYYERLWLSKDWKVLKGRYYGFKDGKVQLWITKDSKMVEIDPRALSILDQKLISELLKQLQK